MTVVAPEVRRATVSRSRQPAGAPDGRAGAVSAAGPPVTSASRIGSIDALRGLVMCLMLAEAMHLWTLHQAFPGSWFWSVVAFNTTHVEWQGCSLHDLIQPAFSLLVGAALPFSLAPADRGG